MQQKPLYTCCIWRDVPGTCGTPILQLCTSWKIQDAFRSPCPHESYMFKVGIFTYFFNAFECQRPICWILSSGIFMLAAVVAAPIRNILLEFRCSRCNRVVLLLLRHHHRRGYWDDHFWRWFSLLEKPVNLLYCCQSKFQCQI